MSATPVLECSTTDATTTTTVAGGQVPPAVDYVPAGGAFEGPDASSSFQYVEVAGAGERCFTITAYNATGESVPSAEACGSPGALCDAPPT